MTPTAPPVELPASPASLLDYHLLDPALTFEQVADGCRLARELELRAVVVRPCDMQLASQWMAGSSVRLCSTAGYPDGTSTTAGKLYELRDLLRLGAKEIELQINPALLLSRSFQHIEAELLQASESCRNNGARLIIAFGRYPFADDLRIICTKIAKRVEAAALSVPYSEALTGLLKPLLKDVLTLKSASPVQTFDEVEALRSAGYTSVVATDPESIVAEWKTRVTPQVTS
jgi:deoxyribose-phosphate aldolase